MLFSVEDIANRVPQNVPIGSPLWPFKHDLEFIRGTFTYITSLAILLLCKSNVGNYMNQDYIKSKLDYNPETGDLIWTNPTSFAVNKGSVAGSYCKRDRYINVVLDGKRLLAHRVAWFIVTGVWPVEIDHINHIRHDNRWDNLREVSHINNHRNKPLQSNNISGYHGVGWEKSRKKWGAAIKVNGKKIQIGRFNTKEEAVAARKKAEQYYGFHNNHGQV